MRSSKAPSSSAGPTTTVNRSAATATDPYRRRSPVGEQTVRFVGLVTIGWGLAYLVWRLQATRDGASAILFWALLAAELVGWLGFVLLVTQSWHLPDRNWSRRHPAHAADIVVTTYNDPLDAVRRTLLGALSVAGAHTVVLSDDGDRDELKALAGRLGVPYIHRASAEGARAGNVNAILPRLSSELVVLLAAGEVPMPDTLTATDRYFDDPEVAVVGLGTRDASRSRITHNADDRHELALEKEVIIPSLDRSGNLPWTEGPAIVRREALLHIGGMATQTQTPEYQTGIRLQRQGLRNRHHAETICETYGPQSVEALMRSHERITRGRWSALRTADSPLFASGLSMRARLGHASVLIRPVMAIQKLTMIAVLAASLFSGLLPLNASMFELAFVAVPYLVLAGAGRVVIARGRLAPGDLTRQDLRYLGTHLTALSGALFRSSTRFRYVPKDPTTGGGAGSLSRTRLLTGILCVLVAAVAFRTVAMTRDSDSLRGMAVVLLLGIAGWLIVQIMDVLGMLSRHVQRRRLFRVLTDMQAIVDDTIVNVLDISPTGMGLETADSYEEGAEVIVVATLSDARGATQAIELSAVVRNSRQVEERSTWRIGVEFTQLHVDTADLLVWFCGVAHPYHSLRRGVEVPLVASV